MWPPPPDPDVRDGDRVTIDGQPYTVNGSYYGFDHGHRVRTYKVSWADQDRREEEQLDREWEQARRRRPDPIPAPKPFPARLRWTATRLDGGPHGR